MTWLINVDNGGTTTGFCLVDGGEVRYTKSLTTPYDLSRCLDVGDEALSREPTARVNDLSARGARRLVIAVSGPDGADGEARAKDCTPVICSARSRCCSPGNRSPTSYDIRAPGRACSTRSCTRPLSASSSTPTGGCGTPGPASRRGSSGGG